MESYEKKYKEALERAKRLYEQGTITESLSHIFPELKESEDERIRKTLIRYMASVIDIDGVKGKDIIAWLEKQGEPTDINPSEFDSRLNKLLKQFETLPKEEIESSLAFYLNVVQNNGTYKEEKQGVQKPAIEMISAEESLGISSKEWNKIEEECIFGDDRNEPKFKVGDIIEYVGERKELIDVKYEIKEIGNDFYVTTSGVIIPFKFEEYYINKTEPKFKVENGKWYICTQTFVLRGKIIVIKGQVYQAQENGAIKGEEGCLFVDKHDGKASEYFRLWTIQDAKDGDVLINWNNTVFIFKAIEDETVKFHIAYNERWDAVKTPSTKLSHLGLPEPQFEFHPATKEQRDLLFSKMKEAGYEWDVEKKELKKIEQKPVEWHREDEQNLNVCLGYIPDEFLRRWLTDIIHVKYDKLAWSKKDERIYQSIIDDTVQENQLDNRQINWIKFLKDRYTWKPSDEQMEALKSSTYCQDKQMSKVLFELYQDLKKLRED